MFSGQYFPHLTPAAAAVGVTDPAIPLRLAAAAAPAPKGAIPPGRIPSTRLVNMTMTRTFCCHIICQNSGDVSSPGPGEHEMISLTTVTERERQVAHPISLLLMNEYD